MGKWVSAFAGMTAQGEKRNNGEEEEGKILLPGDS